MTIKMVNPILEDTVQVSRNIFSRYFDQKLGFFHISARKEKSIQHWENPCSDQSSPIELNALQNTLSIFQSIAPIVS